MTLTKSWLQKQITDLEVTRDEIPFGLDEDGNNTLAALKMALAGMEAEPVASTFGYLRVVSGRSFQIMEGSTRPPDRSGDCAGPWFPIWTSAPAPQPLTTSERAELENYRNAQQVVPDAIEPDYEVIKAILPTANPDEYACCIAADMWNACRAAMLQAKAEPVSNRDELATMTNQSEQVLDMVNSPVIQDGWVACCERMPETDFKVLANVKSTAVEYQCLAEVDENGRWWDEYGEQLPSPFVTHWQPLPAAPQQEVKP